MAYSCDPIIECNLNVGTIFSGPFEGEDREWEIIERMPGFEGRSDTLIVKLCGGEAVRNYTINQFGYLISVKRIFKFVKVII